jgi:hypothetical protein
VSRGSLAAPAALLLAFLAPGCRTVRPEPAGVPAVIVDPSDASRAALAEAVGASLNGAPVTLADDALTRSSTLVVERARLRDPAGLPAQGRDLGSPERFHLVKRGARCVLLHERTGRASSLEATTCAPSAE